MEGQERIAANGPTSSPGGGGQALLGCARDALLLGRQPRRASGARPKPRSLLDRIDCA